MISVLIVDDSPTIIQYLNALVEDEPELMVIGTAVNGLEAVDQVKRLKPDVVIMDIEMPELDGIAATQRIMAENPVPIVICSANLDHGVAEKTYRAIEAGALAAVAKPKGIGASGAQEMIKSLLHKVKLMAAVKVVRRPFASPSASLGQPKVSEIQSPIFQELKNSSPKLVAIGASTGGPMVLMSLLAKLSPSFPLPILIVQHISQGFLEGMLSWMQGQAALPLSIAVHDEKPLCGHVYFAPDGCHLELSSAGRLCLTDAPSEYNVKPAVASLFRSLAQPAAPLSLGILLTGMGRDGALELLAMRKRGHLTIAQDEESSIVNGMPGEAARLGAVQARMNPEAIGELLNLL
ncbi:MAG: chemotaxis-specific protein-glutamate methyltransferase CheB [Pseudomonadota bacterium]|nr:chemotaxis-specific protein-glutamate methyltransferase CheB [Pseudomonadota bacterium]